MTIICCQVQIDRLSFMTEKDVTDICVKLETGWPESISHEAGDDDGRYVNLFLTTSNRAETWGRIRSQMIESKLPGGELRNAMIVTMTGPNGWDDYLLLHHFDRTEPLDVLEQTTG
ncbi:hypothetical protein V7x_55620 [Crateriforma conspicua]|uniref:Uncharacterized protein n=1 Tax=Crateriforma conspicua TaxID=2527996 RepID=A0A5C6FHN9_9PLAN|nr:hypothetical protein [Crateriforma conspicua]TWU59546.1 hypothetical protein V7x_55620 [Crateriforma conspicua]